MIEQNQKIQTGKQKRKTQQDDLSTQEEWETTQQTVNLESVKTRSELKKKIQEGMLSMMKSVHVSETKSNKEQGREEVHLFKRWSSKKNSKIQREDTDTGKLIIVWVMKSDHDDIILYSFFLLYLKGYKSQKIKLNHRVFDCSYLMMTWI